MPSKKDENIVQVKIVYWGPGESGKTTNFRELRKRVRLRRITRGYSIETSDGRTLWQDALFFSFHFALKNVRQVVIAQVITCTGQERFLTTREYVLDGADGIVFVGDSEPRKMEENKRSYRELISLIGKRDVPCVVQLNKRDLDDAVSIEAFKKQLGLSLDENYSDGSPIVYPAVAMRGENVVECFQDLMFQVLVNHFK